MTRNQLSHWKHQNKANNHECYFIYLTGNKNTEEATAKQSDAESDTEDEEEGKAQAAPEKKKY